MKIKTGARILALSALTTMMFSASALAKIEEGKLVIWINGDKGYNGPLLKSVRNSRQIPELKSPLSIRINWKRNSLRLRQLAMALIIIFWAHDRFGGYAQSGLLAEITPTKRSGTSCIRLPGCRTLQRQVDCLPDRCRSVITDL